LGASTRWVVSPAVHDHDHGHEREREHGALMAFEIVSRGL
jgi:hypothetical protein